MWCVVIAAVAGRWIPVNKDCRKSVLNVTRMGLSDALFAAEMVPMLRVLSLSVHDKMFEYCMLFSLSLLNSIHYFCFFHCSKH